MLQGIRYFLSLLLRRRYAFLMKEVIDNNRRSPKGMIHGIITF